MIAFIKLTENDKRLIIVLLLLIIILFVIAGYVGLLVKKIMHKQGNKMEDLIYDVIETGVIKSPKKLRRYGRKKNHQQLVRDSWIPFILMILGVLSLLLYCVITNNWQVDIFDIHKTGIGTLFFHFDWSNAPKTKFFGLEIVCDWPPLLSSPHWSSDAWGAYLFFGFEVIGGIWFLVCVQAYIARSYRLISKSKTVFLKSLDNIHPENIERTPINPE